MDGFQIEGEGQPGHRRWAVQDAAGLVCLCCYRRGAIEVVRRLTAARLAVEAARDALVMRLQKAA